MKKLILAFLLTFTIFCTHALAATTLVKAIDASQLALDEKAITLWNGDNSAGILQTTKNLYLLTATSTGTYTIEKVPLPTFLTGETIADIWFSSKGVPVALVTSKGNIYIFKTT